VNLILDKPANFFREFLVKTAHMKRLCRQVEPALVTFDQMKGLTCENQPDPVKSSVASVSEIYSFRAISERLGTAGQPTESQFPAIRRAGFEAVINLALPTSDNALANEGSIVTGLGMSYVHIPVDFKSPTSQDFQAFSRVMGAFEGRPVFVHCAANMRVSAFVFLYRVLHRQVPVSEAERDLHAIWEPDEVWSRFIQKQLASK
jgi:protein tyrosine phosphatase (PTP) superfamily phosphohydrolase (DUF442 family)